MSGKFVTTNRSGDTLLAVPAVRFEWQRVYFFENGSDAMITTLTNLGCKMTTNEAEAIGAAYAFGGGVIYRVKSDGTHHEIKLQNAIPPLDAEFKKQMLTALADADVRASVVAAFDGTASPSHSSIFQ